MASLSDKAGVLIAANFVKYAVGFVMPMVLVRMLSKQDYGTLQQLQLIGASTLGILVLGLPSSVYYFHQRDGEHSHKALIQQTLWMLFISGTVATLGLVLAAPRLSELMNNPALSHFLPLFAFSVGLGIAGEHFVHFMIAQDRYATAVIFETGETIVRVLVSVMPLLAGYGLPGLLWAIVAMTLARFLVRNLLLLRGIGFELAPERGSLFIREQFGYSIPMCLTSIVGLVGGALDRMIIAANFTPVQYAIYSVGALEIPLDTIFQVAVANVLRASLPALVRSGQYAEIARLVREAVRKLSMIMLPSFVFLYGFSSEFITLLFTKNYAESVAVFRIYLWLVPLHMFILSPIPQAFGRTKINFYIVASVTALHVGASFVLLRWLGYLGPAVSTVASTYLIALLYFVMGKRLLHATTLQLMPIEGFAKVGGAALVALFVSRQAFGSGQVTLVQFLLAGALFSAVFLLAAMALRVFTEQDRQLARRWAGRFGLVRR